MHKQTCIGTQSVCLNSTEKYLLDHGKFFSCSPQAAKFIPVFRGTRFFSVFKVPPCYIATQGAILPETFEMRVHFRYSELIALSNRVFAEVKAPKLGDWDLVKPEGQDYSRIFENQSYIY